ncbi:MAG: SHOCT domain-containing protein [Chloroflexota bacterium]
MVKLGVLLIIFSVAFLLVTIFSPDIIAPLAPIYCAAGQKLKSTTYTYSRPGETSSTNVYHCVNSDNVEQSDVTGPITLTVMGGFCVLLAGGIGLTILGTTHISRTARASSVVGKSYVLPTLDPDSPPNRSSSLHFASTHDQNIVNANMNDIMDGLQHGVIRFGGQEIKVADLKAGNYQMNGGQASQRTLSETLRQLEDAHTQGLINDDEYQKLRQEALDKLI